MSELTWYCLTVEFDGERATPKRARLLSTVILTNESRGYARCGYRLTDFNSVIRMLTVGLTPTSQHFFIGGFMSFLKNFIDGLRKKSKRLYQTGWHGDNMTMERDIEISQPTAYVSIDQTSTIPNAVTHNFKTVSEEDKRIEKKPVEVVKEIISEAPVMNLVDLDKQIRIVARRMKVLKEEAGVKAQDEEMALAFLKARQKYVKYVQLFQWQVTTMEKINALCQKYKVSFVGFKSFYKSIPMEAVDEIEKFAKAFAKVCKEEPVFHMIIDSGGKETRKDPILLAASPFGRWLYILGAWDKEVEIVDDLIYKGK